LQDIQRSIRTEEELMAHADWRLEGEWLKNCSCAYGCPCDFNARPTQGWCKGFLGMRITQGHFEATRLDGLSFFAVVHFPGPLHEGNGELQPIIDERATPEQREALFKIMSGQHSAEGTLFHICSLIVTKMHEPVFAPVTLEFDEGARKARLVIPGVLETEVEPIKNPVTGAPHRVQVVMPEGFEHRVGEIASADIRSTGAIPFETHASHSTLAHVTQAPEGVLA
jgi:hypothetical protein